MYNISSLLKSLPAINQSRMISSGYGVWIVWKDELNKAVPHTFKDYGGVPMVEEGSQALWFFSNKECFRALARLYVWTRLNDMPVFCEAFPVTLLVGYHLEVSLSAPTECHKQQVDIPEEFEVWLHPKLREDIKGIPGLNVEDATSLPGMSNIPWLRFTADQGLDYEAVTGWYFCIRPLGRMNEKDSVMGWRAFFSEFQPLLQRMGIKYISDETKWFVVFPLENIRGLRTMCMEMLKLVQECKDDEDRAYWPCVMAAMAQKNLPFSTELPNKFNLDWRKLTPDFPHLQFKDAFQLSEWFKINDVQYGGEDSIESWCNVRLREDAEHAPAGTLEVALPRKLLRGGDVECFYCGLRNHAPAECPSRDIPEPRGGVWQDMARLDMKEITDGLEQMEEQLDVKSMEELLADTGTVGLLTRCLFEINAPSQLRLVEMVWRSKGKEWPAGLRQVGPGEGEYIWKALEVLRGGEREEAQDMLKKAALKYTRSYQPPSLQGFAWMESGDMHQARFYWEESERLSYTPLQQGYFVYLQARSLEIEGECHEAANLYKRASNISPSWLDPVYRQGVCLVKMGFTGQALDVLSNLVEAEPNFFNRILLDPELDRGRLHLMGALWDIWNQAEELAEEEAQIVERIQGEIDQWFDSSHEFYDRARDRLDSMQGMLEVKNYVAYRGLIRGVSRFTEEMDAQIDLEIKRIESRLDYLHERLKIIQKEAAWFPFPRLLTEFNREFNACVERINWIRNQHLKQADTFRKTRRFMGEIEENLTKLQSRLVTLRIIRDSTLFTLLLGRNFIWFELIGLGLALVSVPLFIWLTKGMESNWIVEMVLKQRWEFQKGLILILSILALAGAAIKSAIAFDRKKRELFKMDEDDEPKGKKGKAKPAKATAKASAKK